MKSDKLKIKTYMKNLYVKPQLSMTAVATEGTILTGSIAVGEGSIDNPLLIQSKKAGYIMNSEAKVSGEGHHFAQMETFAEK